ncbi:hypothetical protein EM20IM_08320 [Candidatus Methylacidiphilum infernorum]|uniref:Uncharacterized protein n=1 Tax=Candidatus Methylacidiphilum infernorum TaxID=511746 RepID=A0ABX7PUQ8_9BACT|nr:hypothetical protein [Candidatus Methylacidiphilum infernorum]QSR86489.1 hypothetical protein EM20IM_08320 [Candidatus Methylacidiphilum infernorum]
MGKINQLFFGKRSEPPPIPLGEKNGNGRGPFLFDTEKPEARIPISKRPKKQTLLFAIGIFLAVVTFSFLIYFLTKPYPGSTANDEIHSSEITYSKYLFWNEQISRYMQSGVVPFQAEGEGNRPNFWQLYHDLPNMKAVKAALLRHLPQGFTLLKIEPVRFEKTKDFVQVTYNVKVLPSYTEWVVPRGKALLPASNEDKIQKKLVQLVIFTRDLPPGFIYFFGEKKILCKAQEAFDFSWTVKKAVVQGGVWRILEVGPTPFEDAESFAREGLVLPASEEVYTVKSDPVLNELMREQDQSWQNFFSRINQIRDQVVEYRNQLVKDIPGVPKMGNPFASGSGTPTTTLEGAGIGLLGGALIGGLAGGGLGAGIGAGLGMLGGGLGGYLYSHERRKSLYRRRLAERREKIREINEKVEAYRDKLVKEYEEELKERIQARQGQYQAVRAFP